MERPFNRGSILADIGESEVTFDVKPTDRMFTVLLGSQPSIAATLNYVKKLTAFAKESPNIPTHLFVYCAEHKEKEESLFRSVADFVSRIKKLSKKLFHHPFYLPKRRGDCAFVF